MCGCNKKKVDTAAPAATSRIIQNNPPSLPTFHTHIWGPSLWKSLHIAAIVRSESPQWPSILSAMTTGLPCPECSAHYNNWHKRQYPSNRNIRVFRPIPFLSNRAIRRPPQPLTPSTSISVQLLGLHNEVNQRLGKPQWTMERLVDSYGIDTMKLKDDAIAALQSLNGIIGTKLYSSLLALLHSL